MAQAYGNYLLIDFTLTSVKQETCKVRVKMEGRLGDLRKISCEIINKDSGGMAGLKVAWLLAILRIYFRLLIKNVIWDVCIFS